MEASAVARLGRSLAGRAMRYPRGARLLRTALEAGLPKFLGPPLRYLVTGRLGDEDTRRVMRVERLRSELLARSDEVVEIISSPKPGTAGQRVSPNLRPVHGEVKPIDLGRVATHASVDSTFGTLLYLFARASSSQTILELGSCAGIASSYMAAAGCSRFIGVEGSSGLAELARSNVRQIQPEAQIIEALFDDALDALDWPDGIDMTWIDGQHEKSATLHYFQRIRDSLNPGAVVVFDDITWSQDMREAWNRLRCTAGFSDTIDLGRIGAAVWQGGPCVPRVWDLAALRGRPAIGNPHP